MKIQKYFFVFILLWSIASSHAYANSPVWKISKNGNHLFLGGTIHLLTQADYPLPSAFEAAYKNSMILVLETDLQKYTAPEFQQKMIQKTMYQGDQDITQVLQPETIEALKTHLASRGIPLKPMLKFKPGMLSISLTMIELQTLGLVGTGVDQFYSLRAINESKKMRYLETVDEQLEFLVNMGQGSENELILYTLNDIEHLPKFLGSMKEAWKRGDNAQMQRVAMDPWIDRFPHMYDSLIVDRNNNWVPQIEEMLRTEEIELILFGYLHLVGEDGILEQLEVRGYTIENQ